MNLYVKKLGMPTKRKWDHIWSKCEYATYFQSREWAEILETYSNGNYQPSPFSVKFSDGTQAIFPLTWHNSQQRYISSPAETYGGLISLDNINRYHTYAMIDFFSKTVGKLFIRLNPFFENSIIDCSLPLKNDDTQILILNNNFADILKKWSQNHVVATKIARKKGVSVRIASSVKDWLDYYKMYKASLQRWGENVSSQYSWSLFETILSLHSKNIKLWMAYFEEKPIAGALCFYSKKHVVYWHGAAFSEYFKLKPVQLMFYEAILDAVNNSYSWFDFNPSGGHKGVKEFKKKFGTTAMLCPWDELEGPKYQKGWKNSIKKKYQRFRKIFYNHFLII